MGGIHGSHTTFARLRKFRQRPLHDSPDLDVIFLTVCHDGALTYIFSLKAENFSFPLGFQSHMEDYIT